MATNKRTTNTATVEVLEWIADYLCPWDRLPDLEHYKPLGPGDNEPATYWQKIDLKRFFVRCKKRGLTFGEARHLVFALIGLNDENPVTDWRPGKAWHLRYGIWCPGMTRKERAQVDRIQKLRARSSWEDLRPGVYTAGKHFPPGEAP